MLSSGSRWVVGSFLLLGALGTGCGVSFNQPPKVTTGPVASAHDVESGAQVQLQLVVTEPEGEKLRFSWLQSPGDPAGAFSDTSVQEPSWTAPEVTALQDFLLTVYIKDAEDNTVQGLTSISVYPHR